MKLETNTGRTLDAEWIWPDADGTRLMLETKDARPMAEMAKDFDGLLWMTTENAPGVTQRFDGFSRLTSISRENAEGVTRLILRKEG